MHLDRRHQTCPPTLAACLLLSLAGQAHCQTSADLSLVSEYAARGVALDTRPVPQLRVEYDADEGWYGGAFASPASLGGRADGQLIAYGGRARRLDATLSWDAGVSRSVFAGYGRWNYHELYAGLSTDRASARLFYSPAYYGDEKSLYLDLNASYPLGERLGLSAHAGLLHLFGERRSLGRATDLRLALVTEVGDVSLQAGWQIKGNAYLPGTVRARALTASASLRF